jgi:multidrug efflux pump subunit AcrB
VALVTFKVPGEDDVAKARVDASLAATAAAQKAHPGVRVEQFGDASADKALSKSFDDDFKKAEFLSLPITLVILIVAFGALVAAGLPLLLGLTAVMGTVGLLGPVSQIVPLDESISSVVLLIGLAVGVDYSMFYLRREMEERDAGRGPQAALEAAAATSGRAVLVSGFTVMVAMAGMFLAGNAVFESFAVGTILVVAVAMIGSVTVVPAMLAFLSRKGWTEKGRRALHREAPSPATTGSRAYGARSSTVSCAARSSPPCSRPGSCSGWPSRASASTRSTRASPACRAACRSCRPTTASRPRSPAARCRPWSPSRPVTSPRPRSSRASATSSARRWPRTRCPAPSRSTSTRARPSPS